MNLPTDLGGTASAPLPAAEPRGTLGHLARLVERVTPHEATLRRRRPALFETPGRPGGPPMAPHGEVIDGNATRSTLGAAPLPPTLTPSVHRATVHHTVEPSPSRPPAQHTHAPATPAATERRPPDAPPRIDATFARPALAAAPTAIAPSAATTAAQLPLAPQPVLRPTQADTTRQPHSAARSGERLAEASPRQPSRANADTTQRTSISVPQAARADTAAHPAPAPSAPTPAPTHLTRIAARRQAAPPQPAPRPAARELPPVEVTIGRIEVRAMTTAPHPSSPPSSATAPRLGLDQYLRDRGGSR